VKIIRRSIGLAVVLALVGGTLAVVHLTQLPVGLWLLKLEWSRTDQYDRRELADEMVAEDVLIGLTKRQCYNLLGRPAEEFPAGELSVLKFNARAIWYVGWSKLVFGFGRATVLGVDFDENEKVAGAQVYDDFGYTE